MTVTPFTRREPHAIRPRRWSRPDQTGPDDAGLTLSVEVTLTGDNRYSEAVEIIEVLRRLTSTWESASVAVTPSVRPVDDGEPEVAGTVTWLDPTRPDAAPATPATATVVVSPAGRSVLVDGVSVEFTRVEFDLLHFLAAHPRRAFSRAQLLQSVWGYSHAGHRTVDVHVRRIRAKLGNRPLVTTIRSIGYRLADNADVVVA